MSEKRIPIALKLLSVYLVPTIATFAGFSFLAHFAASRGLEEELGRRLVGVAATAARDVEDEGLSLLQPGDEGSRTYRNLLRRLTEIRDAAGVARIYIFDADARSLVDTTVTPIGEKYYSLSRSNAELQKTRGGSPTASVLFSATDGGRYKSAFAAIPDADGSAHYVVGVDGAAAMYQQLASLRRTLATAGAGGIFAVVLLSLIAARLLVAPIRKLEQAAARIGRGDLDAPIVRSSRDEIGTVAETLEQMRLQLRSRDERMQMMLAGIAHEVRNPLGGLQLYAGLLREEIPTDRAELADYVHKVEREIEHLKNIVSDFLEFARRPRPTLAPIDLAAMLEEIRQLAIADRRGVKITVEIAGGASLRGDAGQIRRAILNLVQNALQASADAGEVIVRAESSGATTRIVVADGGAGINADALAKIWTPFFTTKQKGTGLGLAFVREIVEDHGGRAEVDSAPDRGTTFTLTLPSARA